MYNIWEQKGRKFESFYTRGEIIKKEEQWREQKLQLGLRLEFSGQECAKFNSSIFKALLEVVSTIDIFLAMDFQVLDAGNVEVKRVVLDHVSTAKAIIDNLTPSVAIKVL